MSNKVIFEDYSAKVLQALETKTLNFLEEAGGLVESKAKENTRVASGKTRRDWGHIVDEKGLKVTIGNTNINGLYEEFGTGEYDLYGKGRKGGWWICSDQLDGKTKALFESKYHFKKRYGEGGKVFYYTTGKKGTRALMEAFQNSKGAIDNKARAIFKELNNK